jgi:hypothetical protein
MPQPAVLRVLKGETRPSQVGRNPKPQEPPVRPDDLAPAEVAVWDRIMAATAHTRHIGQLHADAFRHYCEVTVAAQEMQPKGSKEWRELVNTHRQLARELCLTPATSGHLAGKIASERKLDRFTHKTG